VTPARYSLLTLASPHFTLQISSWFLSLEN
jgi:hypothetical protein